MILKVGTTIPTPCGDVEVSYQTSVPGLSIDFSFLLNFPPKWHIPMPDCSLLKHLGSAPEPPEDSVP